MSYYIGATGEYIWEELLDNTTSNVIISNHINFDAGPLTDAIQETITDALGTAVGELIAPITEVPSATGVGVVALTALGLLSYYKLNRTAVQDVDSMVYSADYASILTPGMFDDRVRIRYDNNQFSNVFYNVNSVKKGEILTSRINLLPTGTNDINLYTSTGKVGIGTTPLTQLHIYKGGDAAVNIIRLETPVGGSSSIEFKRGTDLDVHTDFRLIGYNGIFKLQYENNELAYGDIGTDIIYATKTQISIFKPTAFIDNVGIGIVNPATQLHIYNEVNPSMRIQSIAAGTPIVEFMRGTSSDANKDYRFISESDIFKLQVQDATTYYMDNTNQLIWANATDVVVHKPTEFKANVLIGGDTRAIGYVGIGTTAATPLHIYTAAANILRLQTAAVNGTNSIEFMRGNSTDPLTDYRLFTDTTGKFKIQYANNLLAYGAAETDLIELSTTNTIIYKPTEFKGNVGVGTVAHATYKVDVLGTVNATAFRGSASEITDIGADKITTGTLNNARLTLTGTKLMEACDTNTFIANPSDKLDLIPIFTFNILAYDRLANTTASYLEAGKFACTYEDRNGIYTLLPSYIPDVNNKVILNYRVGDKITFKNTAVYTFDYTEVPQQRWARLSVFKMPSGTAWTSQGRETYMTSVFDWDSDSLNVVDWTSGSAVNYTRQTPVTMQIQAGFKYFFVKWQRNNEANLFNSYITPATEVSGMNIAFGGGQGFKISGDYTGSGGYKPLAGSNPPYMTEGKAGTARRGARLSIDEETGVLSADIPTSANLITNMNTSHFTNNVATGKIDISTAYVAPKATILATARNIAGVSFDGSGAINIPYDNLTSKPSLFSGSYTDLTSKPTLFSGSYTDLTNKPTLFSGSYTDLTNKPTIPAAQVNSDWAATTGISVINNKPTLFSGSYTDLTSKPTLFSGSYTDLTSKPTLFSGSYTDLTSKPTLITSTDINNTSNYVSRIGSELTTAIGGKAPTTHTHTIANITDLQTTLDGKAPTSHTHTIANITNLQTTLDGKQATLTAGTGISIVSNTISATTANKWITSTTDTTEIYYNDGNVGIGTNNPTNKLHIRDDTTNTTALTIQNNYIPSLPTEIVVVGTTFGTIGTTDRYISFPYSGTGTTKDYTFTTTEPLICDILIIGGGGAGGFDRAGGGGAGSCIVVINQILGIGTYPIKVGRGQVAYNNSQGQAAGFGDDSEIYLNTTILYRAKGGGMGGSGALNNANVGGCGGGAASQGPFDGGSATNLNYIAGNLVNANTTTTTYANLGFKGGNQLVAWNGSNGDQLDGAGGGGIGGAGINHNVGEINGTAGGAGLNQVSINGTSYNFQNYFANGGTFGVSGYIGGGGGGGNLNAGVVGNGGVGGGGNGGGSSAISNTGGGGGGGAAGGGMGGNGGSGIVIIRYRRIGTSTTTSSVIELIRGTTTDANHDWKLGNYNGDFVIKKSVDNVETDALIIYKNQNDGRDSFVIPDGELNVAGTIYTTAISSSSISVTGNISSGTISTTGNVSVSGTITGGNITTGGTITGGNITTTNVLTVGGQTNLRNTYIYSGNETTNIGLYFATPFTGSPTGAAKSAIIAEAISTWSRHHLAFCLNRDTSNTANVTTANCFLRLHQDNYIQVFRDLRVFAEIYAQFRSVSQTNSDYLCITPDVLGLDTLSERWIRVAFNSFTAFHRCYTDDELYNNDTQENIDLFKNNFMGCVVIATGKIKTDLTRTTEALSGPDDVEVEPKAKREDPEWYSEIDKDGITIEDAVPIVRLSRKKKDKRVFGVLGAPKRNTNNPNRLIVNSIGEGAICVVNTNGNIENGDYLQSSDLLGYGEKQDDDLLHNYTIGKATIDCDFELDSPYYQCKEIENGVRVAFIACSYHCG